MLYYFQEHKFIRNQVVYREGDETVDGVYFIKNGEFEMTKKVQKPKDIKQKEKQH